MSRRVLTGAIVGAVCTAIVAVTPRAVVRWATRRRVVEDPDAVGWHDAVVVPGAGVLPDGTPTRMLVQRVEAAAALLRAGRVERVVLSGDSVREGYDEVGAMVRVAAHFGVPPDRIVRDPEGISTAATCRNARVVAGVRDGVVVTQRFHAHRAAFLARAAGLGSTALALPDLELYGRREVLPLMAREVAAAWKAVSEVALLARRR